MSRLLLFNEIGIVVAPYPALTNLERIVRVIDITEDSYVVTCDLMLVGLRKYPHKYVQRIQDVVNKYNGETDETKA